VASNGGVMRCMRAFRQLLHLNKFKHQLKFPLNLGNILMLEKIKLKIGNIKKTFSKLVLY